MLQGGVGAGGSVLASMPTGKASTVSGGTVETGELHSVLEPLRRASRCRFLYSSKETWEDAERQGVTPAGGSITASFTIIFKVKED